MKKQYKYKTCALCKEVKDENRSPYCKICSKEYGKNYRLLKRLKPNINLVGLGGFIDKVNRNSQYIEFQDILTILFFYEIITNNINEYDNYSSGKQIQLMWKRINNYYDKRQKEKLNI
jgi:hypothetical protein